MQQAAQNVETTLGGKADAGQEKKKETDADYADRVLEGKHERN